MSKSFGIPIEQETELCEKLIEHDLEGCEFKTNHGYTRFMPVLGSHKAVYGKFNFYHEVLLWLCPTIETNAIPEDAWNYVSEPEIIRYINAHSFYWETIPDVVEEGI